MFSNHNIVFGDLNSDFVIFFSNDVGLKSVTLDNIDIDDDNFDDCDLGTNSLVGVMAWHINLSDAKHLKKR